MQCHDNIALCLLNVIYDVDDDDIMLELCLCQAV